MRAYLSASDKENLEILANNLVKKGYEIYATGNTFKYLSSCGIKAVESSEITGFSELLGGKVKSLHPDIFAGILADEKERSDKAIKAFDLVAIDLYPFEKYMNVDCELSTLISNIDIGGVALLRAAAKNYQNVIVISSKDDYTIDLDSIDDALRQKLALRAFEKTSKYDYLILKKLSSEFKLEENIKTYYFDKIQNLRYGENPHQEASLYSYGRQIDWCRLNGKEMSYNNILDSTAAIEITAEFFDVCACVIIKHTNPACVALAPNIEQSFVRALDSDPISPFGGVVAFSKEVDLSLAKRLTAMFLEVIIAPSYSEDALCELKKKKNLRVIKINTPYSEIFKFCDEEIKLTPFGALIQKKDTKDLDVSTFKVVTKRKPEQSEVEDMIFAFKVVKHAKSNAIVVAKDLRTIGICAGQTSRVGAVEIAVNKVCDSPKGAVIASDGFFPATDNILVAGQNRISAIIQPSGSIKDKEVIETADKYNIAMIATGIRHFKH